MRKVREPAVEGMFYPADKGVVFQLFDKLFASACHKIDSSGSAAHMHDSTKRNSTKPARITPRIFIAPHAGYEYSAHVAACTYCALKNYVGESTVARKRASLGVVKTSASPDTSKNKQYKRFILLGPSHYAYFPGAAVPVTKMWRIFDAKLTIDQELVAALRTNPLVIEHDAPHVKEHSLEVQLPFLYYLFDTDFTFVPVAVGEVTAHDIESLAKTLTNILKKHPDTAIIVSTDLSHYLPLDLAQVVDENTIQSILTAVNSGKNRQNAMVLKPEQACGANPVNIAIKVAQNLGYSAQLLCYDTSATASGGASQVVGYASIVMGRNAKK